MEHILEQAVGLGREQVEHPVLHESVESARLADELKPGPTVSLRTEVRLIVQTDSDEMSATLRNTPPVMMPILDRTRMAQV